MHVYLAAHFDTAGYATTFWGWLGNKVAAFVALVYRAPASTLSSVNDLTCVAGNGEPYMAALYLSVKKGLLAFGWEQSEKLNQTYACLYGVDESYKAAQKGGDLVLVIPDFISFMAILQTLLSAAFIFLFLLAIRNQFRIK